MPVSRENRAAPLLKTAVLFAGLTFAIACGEEPPEPEPSATDAEVGCVGLHGGVYPRLKEHAQTLGVTTTYWTDREIASGAVDLSRHKVVLLEHLRSEDRDAVRETFLRAKRANPQLRLFAMGPASAVALFEDLGSANPIERDAELSTYYGTSDENHKRLLTCLAARYLGRSIEILPPEKVERGGLFHPDHEGMFPDVKAYEEWAAARGKLGSDTPRIAIAVHQTHLSFQQPAVVAALVREFESRGALAVAIVDMVPGAEEAFLTFRPDVVVHTCHSRESVEFRQKLGTPHVHSIFFRSQSIDQWRENPSLGLSNSEQAFQLTSQELLGAIEPQIGAGTLAGGGGDEAFVPVPERIVHLADRTLAWARLRRAAIGEKKVALIYYNRELGKSDLMRGSATGMFLNAPRSMVRLLGKMKEHGYAVSRVPANEDELLGWMQDHGRQVGLWDPVELDRLARSGQATLIPVDEYRAWFERRVPEPQRKALIERWGDAPGDFMTWTDETRRYLVVPRIDLGNVVLLPQPLRGEAHDPSRLHDKLTPPPHNYLATYFWLEEQFGADAMVHFGTHGSEFLLPGKGSGLGPGDWPDILLGKTPNLNLWVVNNVGESTPVRRRAYALLIDHLTAPTVAAELSDELKTIHDDLHKWEGLESGALKEKFRETVTQAIRGARLDQDLRLSTPSPALFSDTELERVSEHLHDVVNETTPVSLHVLGETPPDETLLPFLALCLRRPFWEAVGATLDIPRELANEPGDREAWLKAKVQEAIVRTLRQGFETTDALRAIGGTPPAGEWPTELKQGFEQAKRMDEGFRAAHREIDGLLEALDGRYIAPGPANSPDRNPAVLPTGRNMVVLNPEEIPSKASWEIGRRLIDDLLSKQVETTGRQPERIAFTLTPFSAYADYGVMESQILWLLGVRPVWDAQNVVSDVALIPREELGRPRVDVFLSLSTYYRDLMPSRMKLLDKAVRLAASSNEPDNVVQQHVESAKVELLAQGTDADRATALSFARMFGPPPGQSGSASFYYLVEKSGLWDDQQALVAAYRAQHQHAYVEGAWGEESSVAYDRQMQGTEIVLRNWSDRSRSPLSNKYDWYQGGVLSMVVEHATGKRPAFLFSDLRDPDRATMIDADAALTREFHVRLFNRKWIEGMMKEGYAGADQVAVHVGNAFGWQATRPGAIADGTWETIVDVYVRDKKNLGVRDWFEAENPHAFQELAETLLEASRKGLWKADPASLREVATAYAESVARHGPSGGLRSGGNTKLVSYVNQTVGESAPETAARYVAAIATAPGAGNASPSTVPAAATPTPDAAATAAQPVVEGKALRPATAAKPLDTLISPSTPSVPWATALVALGAIVLVVIGFLSGSTRGGR